jgi:apolipoprotein D and lipocalin family protein
MVEKRWAGVAREHRPGAALGLAPALVLSLLVLAMPRGGASAAPPLPLAKVDMSRMYGGWYLVATIPNRFERGLVAPYDVYSKRPDGDIREDFYTRRGSFNAPVKHFVVHDWVRPGTGGAHWRVQIFWPVNLPFLVLYTDPDYRYVLFGEEDRSLGWIYSRTPRLDDADYRLLLGRFHALGYDETRFRKFIQSPEQIGQPGFWSDGVRCASAPAKCRGSDRAAGPTP